MTIEELIEKAAIETKGRELLRKRDSEKLLTMNTEAVGLACKTLAAVNASAELLEAMTNEAWEAYELLMHLVYDDWEESEVMEIGRKKNVC